MSTERACASAPSSSASDPASRRSQSSSCAPSLTSARANAPPSPPAAPVTTPQLPSSVPIFTPRSSCARLDQSSRLRHRIPDLLRVGSPGQPTGSGHIDVSSVQGLDAIQDLAVTLVIEILMDEPGDEPSAFRQPELLDGGVERLLLRGRL